MAQGRTYGRFSGRGGGSSAYEVMAMAKRQGAEVIGLEAYYDYMQAVEAEARKAEKRQAKGFLGGKIGGAAAQYLTPIALGALGLGTGGVGNLVLAALAGTAGSYGGKSIGDALARQWSMGGGLDLKGTDKLMAGTLNYKDFLKGYTGPYGQRRIGDLRKKGTDFYKGQIQDKKDYLDILKDERFMSSILEGIVMAGQVSASAKEIGEGGVMTKAVGEVGEEGYKASVPVELGETWWGGSKIPIGQALKIPTKKPSFSRGWEETDFRGKLDSILDFFSNREGRIE